MTIEFRTNEYRFAHGHTPRGYGNWAFFFHPSRRIEDAFWVWGMYSEAKKTARVEAKRRDVEEVFVGS